jgi:hypothetical protein
VHFSQRSRPAMGEETAQQVNLIGQNVIGRALRAF